MGDTAKNKTSVDILCDMWEQKQQNFEKDIRMLLDKSKWLDKQLSATLNNPAEPKVPKRSQQQLKLDQLMIHLTEELQRRLDKASAKRRLHDWHKSLDKMRSKISVLSQSLAKVGLIDAQAMEQLCDAEDYTQHCYELLSRALLECETLRAQNISILVDQVCIEIDQWCDQTMQFPTVRNYQKDCCTEELLVLLEQQLADIKEYYDSNKLIFELYVKRIELRTRMEAIEDKANSPNRFQNRGGSLLREERERKSISIKLPRIEKQLTELVHGFEERTQGPFLVQGEEILSRIASDWEDYRLAKEQRTRARKKEASEAILDSKTPTSSRYMSLRNTTSVPHFNSTITSLGN